MSTGPYRSGHPSAAARPASGQVECPGCSKQVESSQRTCASCGTPIATVRCGHCYQMNSAESALCTGCGRELGLEPVGEPDAFSCPDCKLPFQLFRGGPGALHDCERCGGQFVDHALLKDLLDQRELYGKVAPRPPPRRNPLATPLRYIPCPICAEIMLRRNFGRSSGVIVDICSRHGMWFDRGELPAVLEFVEAGGLELARLRELDERRESQRTARVRKVEEALAGLSTPAAGNPFDRTRRDAELADAALSLAGFLGNLLK
ncbi:MAG: zf-TFIIB domain-containing protein [Polyangiaceae bacterium]|nr:zf-TFIIB domain-containing protein [Polyangiaceae bacterium]